jgi:hypothetical protein
MLTLLMIYVGEGAARLSMLVVLLAAMAVKAAMIGYNFMHLRHEHRGIIITVVLGLAGVAIALFVGIAPDGVRVFEMRH